MTVEDSEKSKRIVNYILMSLFISILITAFIVMILFVLFPKVLDHKYKNYGIALLYVICFSLIYRQYYATYETSEKFTSNYIKNLI